MVFEGWVVDHLSSWLGHFLDLQRDQLRISLWRAWQTGVTLENIPLRLDAFEYLQLPVRPVAGRIGRLQLQVPWQALRSPLVLEIADARLELELRDPSDLCEGPAGARARAGKQAQLAGAEAAAASDSSQGSAARDTGWAWGLASSLITFLVNRLQIRLSNITLVLRDPGSGLALELLVPSVQTCSPSTALRVLGPALEEVLEHDPAPSSARVRKDVAICGVQVRVSAADGVFLSPEDELPILLPCDAVLHVSTLSVLGVEAPRADAVLTVPALALRLGAREMLALSTLHDALARTAALNRVAEFCPDEWRRERRIESRRLWRYAVNGALRTDARWRAGVGPWMSSALRVEARRRYVAAYALHLAKPAEAGLSTAAAKSSTPLLLIASSEGKTTDMEHRSPDDLEAELSVPEITLCRAVAQRLATVTSARRRKRADASGNAAAVTVSPQETIGPEEKRDDHSRVPPPAREAATAAALVVENAIPLAETRGSHHPLQSSANGPETEMPMADDALGFADDGRALPREPEGDMTVLPRSATRAAPTQSSAAADRARKGMVSRTLSALSGFFNYLPQGTGVNMSDKGAAMAEEEEAAAARLLESLHISAPDSPTAPSQLRASMRLRLPSVSLTVSDGQGAAISALELLGGRAVVVFDGSELAGSLTLRRIVVDNSRERGRLEGAGHVAWSSPWTHALLECGSVSEELFNGRPAAASFESEEAEYTERATPVPRHNEETSFGNVPSSGRALTLRYVRSEGAAPAAEAEIGALVAVAHCATLAALLRALPPPGAYAAEQAAAERSIQCAVDDDNVVSPNDKVDSSPLHRAWTVRAAGVDVVLPLNGGEAGAQQALTFSMGKLSVHSAEGDLCRWALRHVSASVISAPYGSGGGVAGPLADHQPQASRSRPSPSRHGDPGHRLFNSKTSVSVLRPVILQGHLRLPVHGSQGLGASIEVSSVQLSIGTDLVQELARTLAPLIEAVPPSSAQGSPVCRTNRTPMSAKEAALLPPETSSYSPFPTRMVVSLHQQVALSVAFDDQAPGVVPVLTLRCGGGTVGATLCPRSRTAFAPVSIGGWLRDLELLDGTPSWSKNMWQTGPGAVRPPPFPPVLDVGGAIRPCSRLSLVGLGFEHRVVESKFAASSSIITHTQTVIRLADATSTGYPDEPGNFISRLHRSRPNGGQITIQETDHHVHVGMQLHNVLLGHAALIRILALVLAPPEVKDEQVPKSESFALDLADCVAEWRYQPAGSAASQLPVDVADFLLAHGMLAVLEVPRCVLRFPLDGPGERVSIQGAQLSVAALGVGGHALLPVLRLPHARVVVVDRNEQRDYDGVQAQTSAAHFTIDVGPIHSVLHPSQLTMVSVAAQILDDELQALLSCSRGNAPQASGNITGNDSQRAGRVTATTTTTANVEPPPASVVDSGQGVALFVPSTPSLRSEAVCAEEGISRVDGNNARSAGLRKSMRASSPSLRDNSSSTVDRSILENVSGTFEIKEVTVRLLGPHVASAGLDLRCVMLKAELDEARTEDPLDPSMAPNNAEKRLQVAFQALTLDLLQPLPEACTPFGLFSQRLPDDDDATSDGGNDVSVGGEPGTARRAFFLSPGQSSLREESQDPHQGLGFLQVADQQSSTKARAPREEATPGEGTADEEGEVFYEALSRSLRRPSRSATTSGAATSRYYSLQGSESELLYDDELDDRKMSLSAYADDLMDGSPAGTKEQSPLLPLANAQRVELLRLSSRPDAEVKATMTISEGAYHAALHNQEADDVDYSTSRVEKTRGDQIRIQIAPIIISATVELATWEEATVCVGACASLAPSMASTIRGLLEAQQRHTGPEEFGAQDVEKDPEQESELSGLSRLHFATSCECVELRILALASPAVRQGKGSQVGDGETSAVGPGAITSPLPSLDTAVPLWQTQADPVDDVHVGSLLCTLRTGLGLEWVPAKPDGVAVFKVSSTGALVKLALLRDHGQSMDAIARLATGAAFDTLPEHSGVLGLAGTEVTVHLPAPLGGSTRTAPSTSISVVDDDEGAGILGAGEEKQSGAEPPGRVDTRAANGTFNEEERAASGSHGGWSAIHPEEVYLASSTESTETSFPLEDRPTISLQLRRISLWLTQESVAVGWALGQMGTVLAERIADQLVDMARFDSSSQTNLQAELGNRTTALAGGKSESPADWQVEARVGAIACRLALLGFAEQARNDKTKVDEEEDDPDVAMPALQVGLLDVALSSVVSFLADDAVSLTGALKLSACLQADGWSPQLAGWEPLVEPWSCQILADTGVDYAESMSGGDMSHSPSSPPRLALTSRAALELTATQASTAMLGALSSCYGIALEAKPAGIVETVLSARRWHTPASEQSLCNASGAQIMVWLGCEGVRDPAAAGLTPTLIVAPGETVNLPVWPESKTSLLRRSRGLAGEPSSTFGVVVQDDIDDGRQRSRSPDVRKVQATAGSLADSRSGPRRAGFFFQGAGTSGWVPLDMLGSRRYLGAAGTEDVLLDRRGQLTHHLPPRPVSSASFPSLAAAGALSPASVPAEASGLLASVRSSRSPWGGTRVTLHSAVKVCNATGLRLEVRLHTPLGLVAEPFRPRGVLGTLGPGQSLWLPAQHALHGALCVRALVEIAGHPSSMASSTSTTTLLASPPQNPPSSSVMRGDEGGSSVEDSGVMPRHRTSPLRTGSGVLFPPDALMRHGSLQSITQMMGQGQASHATGVGSSAAGDAWPTDQTRRSHSLPQPSSSSHEWSDSLGLPQLLSGGAFHLLCRPAEPNHTPISLCIGALTWAGEEEDGRADPSRNASTLQSAPFTLILSPPLSVLNDLPVPLEISLGGPEGNPRAYALRPLGQASSHAGEDLRLPRLCLHAAGFRPQERPLLSLAALAALAASARERGEPVERVPAPYGCARYVRWVQEQQIRLVEEGQGVHAAAATLRQGLDVASGARVLSLGCALWVYNCTGQPIALRQATEEGGPSSFDVDQRMLPDDKMPEAWLPMLVLPPGATDDARAPQNETSSLASGGHNVPPSVATSTMDMHAAGEQPGAVSPRPGRRLGASVASSLPPISRMTSTAAFGGATGLGAVLSRGEGATSLSSVSDAVGPRRMLGRRKRQGGWGLMGGVEGENAKERTTVWPCLPVGLGTPGSLSRLRLQLRASPLSAPPGSTFWSVPVTLDSQGGAAVVTVPCPQGAAASVGGGSSSVSSRGGLDRRVSRASLVLTVTASPVAEEEERQSASSSSRNEAFIDRPRLPLALYLAPRYLLLNTLTAPVQYKQQGTGLEWELAPGASCPVRWADGSAPLRLCVRLHEAGWLWSGGFGLDSPGDTFIKVRHRDRGDTLLLRVSVAQTGSRAGSLAISLSSQPAGFSPYRIENCSLTTVLIRQRRVRDQQDVLRPYCCLAYAWDEPARPHQLVLEATGGHRLGTWSPDRTPQDDIVNTPSGPLRVVVTAEGPCRVLRIIDPARHPSVGKGLIAKQSPGIAVGGQVSTAGNEHVSPSVALLPIIRSPASSEVHPTINSVKWEVTATLPSVGFSLVVKQTEIAYARIAALQVRVWSGPAHIALELQAAGVQLDDPACGTSEGHYPTVLALPGPRQGVVLGSGSHGSFAGAGVPYEQGDNSAVMGLRAVAPSAAAVLQHQHQPAARLSLVLWHRRPAGVICIEDARLEIAPLSLWLAQAYLEVLGAAAEELREGFDLAVSLWTDGVGGGLVEEKGTKAIARDLTHSTSHEQLRHRVFGEAVLPQQQYFVPSFDFARSSSAPSEMPDQPETIIAVPGVGWAPGPVLLTPGVVQLLGGARLVLQEDRKLFINFLELAPLRISLSFMPAPLSHDRRSGTFRRLVSLAELDDARLRLAGLVLRRPLIGQAALGAMLQRHYVRALLPELVKLVGSATVFGDPIRLVHHLGLGVWAFLATPAAGLVESAKGRRPMHLLRGLLEGPRQGATHIAFALSNAATKATAAAQRALSTLYVDRLAEAAGLPAGRHLLLSKRRGPVIIERHSGGTGRGGSSSSDTTAGERNMNSDNNSVLVWTAGFPRTIRRGRDEAFMSAMLRAIAGLVAEPAADLERSGLVGLARGLVRGSAGVVFLPLASLLDSISLMAASIRRAVAGPPVLTWVRPPRYVPCARTLPRYEESEALGRWLLAELARGNGSLAVVSEQYVENDAQTASERLLFPTLVSSSHHRSGGMPYQRSHVCAMQFDALRQDDEPADYASVSNRTGRHTTTVMADDTRPSFVFCKLLAGGRRCLVLTKHELLIIGIAGPTLSPILLWSCELSDLESAAPVCGNRGAATKRTLRLVAQRARRTAIVPGPQCRSVLPISLCQVDCDPREDIVELCSQLLSASRKVQSLVSLREPWRLV